eukprot:TRINITY_DN608_c2_g1_i1.p1 TRINITY_DN608_c2_g1~~TRINITY_DN608_c2_g1_i1.p1  ORF type:complete len:449 (-),score=100.90 TRINITY_DN608_c2_g1_i1:125-1471(-)
MKTSFVVIPRVSLLVIVLLAVTSVSSAHASNEGSTSSPIYPPVLLMPALTGSAIEMRLNMTEEEKPHWWCEKTSDWFYAWAVSTIDLLPVINECFLSEFILEYNNKTHTSAPPSGVETRVSFAKGGLQAVDYLDAKDKDPMWHVIITNLTTNYGYVYGESIRAAPYDWRYGPDHYVNAGIYDNVTQIVEEMYAANNNTPVVLMSLSMGGPYTALYLSRQPQVWKDKYIRAWMSLSGVFAGSSMAIRALVTEEDVPKYISPFAIQALARTFPSSFWLLPNNNSNVFNESRVFLTTPERNYTLGDMRQLMIDAGVNVDIFDDVAPYNTLEAPGVETVCSYGYNVSTEDTYVFTNDKGFGQLPSVTYDDGDGVVLSPSLEICTNWASNQTAPIHTLLQEGMSHAGELFEAGPMQTIFTALTKTIGPVTTSTHMPAPVVGSGGRHNSKISVG